MERAITAGLLAPLTPGAVFLALSTFEGRIDEGIWFALIVTLISYLTSLILGFPLWRFLERMKINNFPSYLLVGITGSAIVVFAIIGFPFIASGTDQPIQTVIPFMIAMVMCGTLVSSVFWLLLRPDRAE
jgi:chromate transport protein ChrA